MPPSLLQSLSGKQVAVIVPTRSGASARNLARFRLALWIHAFSTEADTCQALQFSYGVLPVQVSPGFLQQLFEAIEAEYAERFVDSIQIEIETDTGIVLIDTAVYGIPVAMGSSDYYYGWRGRINQYSVTREGYTFW